MHNEVASKARDHHDVADAWINGTFLYVVPEIYCSAPDLWDWLEKQLGELSDDFAIVLLPEGTTGLGVAEVNALASPPYRHTKPTSATQGTLVDAWKSLLGRGRIGVDDDFLDIGGNSMTAQRMSEFVRRTFGVELSALDIFEAATVGALAQKIDQLTTRPGADFGRESEAQELK